MPESAATTGYTPRRSVACLWPLRLFTLSVASIVAAIAFLANFPAVEAPHPELVDGTFGWHFNLAREYEHGWPAVYSRRTLSHRTSAEGPPSAWQPWEGPGEWSTSKLLLNLALWSVAIVATAVAAQWWRAQRRAVWQLGLKDLMIATVAAGLVFAWLADQRADYLRERALVDALRARPAQAAQGHQFGARVPAWWRVSWQDRWHSLFDRPCYFYSCGDTDLACQHRHVVAIRETVFHPEFPEHLRKMRRLEAIDLCYARLPYFDVTRQATILRDLAPLPRLRGINLAGTNATDADMAWLGRCAELELIDLSQVDISDRGVAQLARLPRLRHLELASDRISDRGCKSLAAIASLEILELSSRNIHDAGAIELAKLKRLKRLNLTASTTDALHEQLRRELPACKFSGSHYR